MVVADSKPFRHCLIQVGVGAFRLFSRIVVSSEWALGLPHRVQMVKMVLAPPLNCHH